MDSKDGNTSENPNNQVDISEFKHLLNSINAETEPDDENDPDGSAAGGRKRKMPEITVTKVVEYKQPAEVTLQMHNQLKAHTTRKFNDIEMQLMVLKRKVKALELG